MNRDLTYLLIHVNSYLYCTVFQISHGSLEVSGLGLRTKLNIDIQRPFGDLAKATFCSKINHRMLYFKFNMVASEAMEAAEVKKDFKNGLRI